MALPVDLSQVQVCRFGLGDSAARDLADTWYEPQEFVRCAHAGEFAPIFQILNFDNIGQTATLKAAWPTRVDFEN